MRKLLCCLTVPLLSLTLINCGQVGELYLPKDDNGASATEVLDTDGKAKPGKSDRQITRKNPLDNSDLDRETSQ